MSEDTRLLTEIRDLLLVIAEPSLAKRDEKLRQSLRELAGSSQHKRRVVALLDGTLTKVEVSKASGMDISNLRKFVKSLGEAKLLNADDDKPKIVLKLPPNFFSGDVTDG